MYYKPLVYSYKQGECLLESAVDYGLNAVDYW